VLVDLGVAFGIVLGDEFVVLDDVDLSLDLPERLASTHGHLLFRQLLTLARSGGGVVPRRSVAASLTAQGVVASSTGAAETKTNREPACCCASTTPAAPAASTAAGTSARSRWADGEITRGCGGASALTTPTPTTSGSRSCGEWAALLLVDCHGVGVGAALAGRLVRDVVFVFVVGGVFFLFVLLLFHFLLSFLFLLLLLFPFFFLLLLIPLFPLGLILAIRFIGLRVWFSVAR
jgi:hypothetical protein